MNAFSVNSESLDNVSFVALADGRRIAYRLSEGRLPGVVFLSGFRSDMNGTKARALEAWCRTQGRRYLCFDYTGHGQSSGDFLEGTIGNWKCDTIDMLDHVVPGPNLLAGSSMGAWLMVLAALARKGNCAGLLGIASALDFTSDLIELGLNLGQKHKLASEGVIYLPDYYGDQPFPITRALLEDGRQHQVLSHVIDLAMPVRLIHGMCDQDVPWQRSELFMSRLRADDCTLTLIKSGDHRLSKSEELEMICHTLARHPGLQA